MHMPASSSHRATRNGQPRIWSYDALRCAELCLPYVGNLHTRLVLDRRRPFGAWIPVSVEAMEGQDWVLGERLVLGIGPLRLSDFERWFLRMGLASATREHRAREAYVALTEYDHLGLEWRRTPKRIGKPEPRRRCLARSQDIARARLSMMLGTGLEVAEGRQVPEERVWAHLAVRNIRPPAGSRAATLRVCEQCGVVFHAPRAERCLPCRRKPLRIPLHPASEGGHHTDYRAHVTPHVRRVLWVCVCLGCSRGFVINDARTAHCANCRSGAGRVRRARGSRSRGRQRWRFTNERGNLVSAGGLAAVDGVVETDDAEAALRLRASRSLIEIR